MSSVYTIISHSFSFIPPNLPNFVPHSIVCAVFASVSLPRTGSNTVGKSVVHSVVLPLTHELNVREPFGHSLHHAFRHTRRYSVAHCCMHSIIFHHSLHHSLRHSIILTVTPYHFVSPCVNVIPRIVQVLRSILLHIPSRIASFNPSFILLVIASLQAFRHARIASCTHCESVCDFRESYPRREGPWNIPVHSILHLVIHVVIYAPCFPGRIPSGISSLDTQFAVILFENLCLFRHLLGESFRHSLIQSGMYSVLLRCAFHRVYIVDPVMRQSLPHSIKHMRSVVVHPVSITITPIFDAFRHTGNVIAWLAPVCIPSRTPPLTMSVTLSLSPSRPITHSVNRHVPGFSPLRLRIAVAGRCTFHHDNIIHRVADSVRLFRV